MSPEGHLNQVCRAMPSYAGADKWTFVGEWSAAMTDCARHLNGTFPPLLSASCAPAESGTRLRDRSAVRREPRRRAGSGELRGEQGPRRRLEQAVQGRDAPVHRGTVRRVRGGRRGVGVLDGQDGGGRRVGSAGAVGAWGVPGPGDGEDVPGSLLEGDILWIGEAVLIPKLSLRRFVPDGCEDIQCPRYSIVSLAIRRITITARSAPIRRYDAPTVSVALTAEWRQLYYQRWAAVRLASQTEAADSPPNAARLRKLRHFKPRDLVRSDGT
jgi:hypothetical protein